MTSATRDPALDALLHPFATGLLRWPAQGGVLFLRAREGAALHASRPPALMATKTASGAVWMVRTWLTAVISTRPSSVC